jgi:predicted dehydrogenase
MAADQKRIAIVGCGAVGRKRALALGDSRLVACADPVSERTEEIRRLMPGIDTNRDWRAVIDRPDVDIVIVSTVHDALSEIAAFALRAGKHVLVEKPGGRSVAELELIVDAARQSRGLCRVGFNHRYHPAIRKAHDLAASGALGPLMLVRGRYGHGGRLGYEKEWRANPKRSGGGELIDQGIHLIDLSRWFLGDFVSIEGCIATYFWPMPVEDNGFLLLRTGDRQTAFLHASCTEWKNLFSLEIYGRHAKAHIEGLGGSYGLERLTLYQMRAEMGSPDETVWEYPGPDQSWSAELTEFLEDIRLGRQPTPGLQDARAALAIVEEIYRRAAVSDSVAAACS